MVKSGDDIYIFVAKRLTEIRHVVGDTQEDMAKKCGFELQRYQELEDVSGLEMNTDELLQICNAFGVTPNFMTGYSDNL